VKTHKTEKYTVNFIKDRIQIGCKNYSVDEWFNFSDEEIQIMDKGALKWWKDNKSEIIKLAKEFNK